MKQWKFSSKVIWLVFYILLFIFVLLHFVLSFFGLAFTPFLWNKWLFLLAAVIFCNLWFLFFKNREFRWFHFVWAILSVFPALFAWFFVLFHFFIIGSENSVPINMDYKIEGSEVVLCKGYLLG